MTQTHCFMSFKYISGAIAPIATWLLYMFGDTEGGNHALVIASDCVRYIFSFIPAFPLSRGIVALVQVQNENTLCTTQVEPGFLNEVCNFLHNDIYQLANYPQLVSYIRCCQEPYVNVTDLCDNPILIALLGDIAKCHETKSPYTWDPLYGINIDLVWLASMALLFMNILVSFELGITKRVWARIMKVFGGGGARDENQAPLDEDVISERNRVLEALTLQGRMKTNDVLLVSGLTKKFKKVTAVNKLSFGVQNGECFGLLGINGAGKTTSFRQGHSDDCHFVVFNLNMF